jgi:molybdenum cofactor cytidylyltransferase
MGQPKQIMAWGSKPIVRQVVDVLADSGVAPIIVVTGYIREKMEAAVAGAGPVSTIFNPHFADGSLMRSLQVGLRALESSNCEAVLVALGDQPQIEPDVVRAVMERWQVGDKDIVAPSFKGQRGHPILFARSLWPALVAASTALLPRDLLKTFSGKIAYLEVDTDSVLRDVDTPEDYAREIAAAGP